jgi:hypothetical protein
MKDLYEFRLLPSNRYEIQIMIKATRPVKSKALPPVLCRGKGEKRVKWRLNNFIKRALPELLPAS